jgi:hypothetical protein
MEIRLKLDKIFDGQNFIEDNDDVMFQIKRDRENPYKETELPINGIF